MATSRPALALSLLTVLAGSTHALAQQAVVTKITGLPSPINVPNSTSVGVNNAGHFVGLTNLYGFDPSTGTSYPGVVHSFLSTDTVNATDLGVLGTDPPPFQFPRAETTATHINSADQVSAYGGDAAFFGVVYATAWLPAPAYGYPAGLIRLPSLNAPNIDRAWGINDSGMVVGETRDPNNNVRPALWTLQNGSATVTDVAPGIGPNGRCFGINNLGQIVGQLNEPNPIPFNNYFQTFLYLPEPAYDLPAGVNILQAPGVETALNFGFPNCINDLGQTFGRTAGFNWRPALWLPEPAYGLPAGVNLFPGQVFPDESFIRLGSTGLDTAEFNAVNSSGVAVGDAGFLRFVTLPHPRFITEGHAFIWQNGEFKVLEEYLPLGSPWQRLFSATGINDSGVITAYGEDTSGGFFAVKITLDGAACPSGITRQPQNVSACAGDTVAVNVVVNTGGGGPLTYVWRKDGVVVSDGPSPSGGTFLGSSTLQLQILNAGPADSGSYDVSATNSCGTHDSNAATVTVGAPPAFTSQPTNTAACTNAQATLIAPVEDPNAGLAWTIEDTTSPGNFLYVSEGTNTFGAFTFDAAGTFTDTLILSNFVGGPTTARFQAQAFNDCGTTLSDIATLSVISCTCTPDFNNDGDIGTDADIEAFFACLAGNCCATCGSADFNGDGDTGTDADIEAFFRVLAGGTC